jgi:hypothetical protein
MRSLTQGLFLANRTIILDSQNLGWAGIMVDQSHRDEMGYNA